MSDRSGARHHGVPAGERGTAARSARLRSLLQPRTRPAREVALAGRALPGVQLTSLMRGRDCSGLPADVVVAAGLAEGGVPGGEVDPLVGAWQLDPAVGPAFYGGPHVVGGIRVRGAPGSRVPAEPGRLPFVAPDGART